MLFFRLMAGRWASAAKAKVTLGLTRALLRVLAACLFLLALGFGGAGAVIALAAKVGILWALGIACAAALTLAAALVFIARPRMAAPVMQAAPATSAPPMVASEVAFLLGFVAMRALLRKTQRPSPPQ